MYIYRLFYEKIIMNKKISYILLLTATAFNEKSIASDFALKHTPDTPRTAARKYLSGESTKNAQTISRNLATAAQEKGQDPDYLTEAHDLQREVIRKGNINDYDSISAFKVYDAYEEKARTVTDPYELERLYTAQQAFNTKLSGAPEHRMSAKPISAFKVYDAYEEKARTVTDPDELERLYTAQQAFNTKLSGAPERRMSAKPISALIVHKAYAKKLEEILPPEDRVRIHEAWVKFEQANPVSSYSYSAKRPSNFDIQYQQAKREAANNQSLVVSVGGVSLEPRAKGTGALQAEGSSLDNMFTAKGLQQAYGDQVIDISSYWALQGSFAAAYKRIALLLHPDRDATDRVKFQTLQDWKTWVENLTEAEFRNTK